ncbi:hypothetical protein OEZ85_003965 [Tetradesmus obliquus]|uniref:Pentacotripeptide-repeat region of PRORP domain-containing protein n=1 Tax=Tetradesmus obliquus TaxID=3088 RepID=A0ABY8UCZ1_TETOB|nr:hypothetical protein OEZ85_003965 [Tetradesmus obliquus]
MDAGGYGADQGRLFGAVYDMKSLTAALAHVQAGTGDVRRMLASCTFRPRLPGLTKLAWPSWPDQAGLTKLVSQMSREGHWAKSLELYESLAAVGVRPDTTITNAAISACDKGGQWEKALQLFKAMPDMGMERDAITYSALISALSKGRQWGMAIDVFNHMVAEGVECDAVTCCSLITALDKGGQWQLAEQVFIQMYQSHGQFHVLLEGMQQESPGGSTLASPSPLAGTFTAEALSALSIQEEQLPPAEQLQSLAPPGLKQSNDPAAAAAAAAGGEEGAAGAAGAGAAAKPGSSDATAADGASTTQQQQQQQQQQQATHSSPNSVLVRSLSAQLADMGLGPASTTDASSSSSSSTAATQPPPGKDAAAAAAADTSAAAGQSVFAAEASADTPAAAAAAAAAAAGSPNRPPNHPMRSGSGLGQLSQSPLRQGSLQLQRSGSIGLASPSGGIGLRLGRAGSLNSKKSSPNRVCCNALLAAYARAVPPRWKQALKLLEVMWQCGGELVPDIVSYNTVMKACGNAQQTDTAFQLYHHMQQRGIQPTLATYGTLITIASEAQAYGRVKESWGWLQASGLPVHITCVNSYLTALIKEDNWDCAVELFQELKANRLGVRPNSVTYNILMSACLARDKPQTVKVLFDEMLSCSLSPSLISYNTLLHAYAKMGAWQESLGLLQHMCTSAAVRPSTISFNTVFCTLSNVAAAVGDMDRPAICSRALEVYGLMLDQPGMTPDSTLYRNMVSTFAACQAHAVVLQLSLLIAQQGHSLDPATAAAALDALQAQHAWQHAGQLLRACYGVGTVVSQLVVQRLLLACVQEGCWKAAREVLQVSAAAGQLEGIAQLLQQYRSQLQAAHASAGSLQFGSNAAQGLLPNETLDELLFLVFLQGQFETRGWVQALDLYNVMKSDRGAAFAAGNAGVTAALLELLVCCGGTEGLLAAVQLVDSAHAAGAMGHYLLHPGTLGQGPAGSSTGTTPTADLGAATSSALLSPQQQLILQLESASLGENSPQAGSAAAAGSLFGLGGTASSFAGQLGFPGQEQQFAGSPASNIGMQGQGMPQPLTFVDVRGCSAAEAVAILLSWLGQQGGGVLLSGQELQAAVAGAVDASRT